MKKTLIGLLIVSVLFSSCLKKYDAPPCNPTYDACSFVAPAGEVTQVESYLSGKGITDAIKHCSGMYYKIDVAGGSAKANVCSTINFKYKGELTNGTVFQEVSTPIQFALGELITGFKNGIPLIGVGGKIKLYIPPSLGYGSQSNGTIPANSVLIFEVELSGIQ